LVILSGGVGLQVMLTKSRQESPSRYVGCTLFIVCCDLFIWLIGFSIVLWNFSFNLFIYFKSYFYINAYLVLHLEFISYARLSSKSELLCCVPACQKNLQLMFG